MYCTCTCMCLCTSTLQDVLYSTVGMGYTIHRQTCVFCYRLLRQQFFIRLKKVEVVSKSDPQPVTGEEREGEGLRRRKDKPTDSPRSRKVRRSDSWRWCDSLKGIAQYDAMRAIQEVKQACVHRKRLGLYSCVSCVYVLCGIK